MTTVMSPDDVTNLALLLIAETRPCRASVMRIFDSLPLQQRAMAAAALLSKMPEPQQSEVLRRFTVIEHLTYEKDGPLMAEIKTIPVTDEMVSAALAEWYPGEWPDDEVFDKTQLDGLTFREVSMHDMRKAVEAALLCAKRQAPS